MRRSRCTAGPCMVLIVEHLGGIPIPAVRTPATCGTIWARQQLQGECWCDAANWCCTQRDWTGLLNTIYGCTSTVGFTNIEIGVFGVDIKSCSAAATHQAQHGHQDRCCYAYVAVGGQAADEDGGHLEQPAAGTAVQHQTPAAERCWVVHV